MTLLVDDQHGQRMDAIEATLNSGSGATDIVGALQLRWACSQCAWRLLRRDH